jgi:hypothetical protein
MFLSYNQQSVCLQDHNLPIHATKHVFLQIKAVENAQTTLRPPQWDNGFFNTLERRRALEAFQAKPYLNLRLNWGRSLSD